MASKWGFIGAAAGAAVGIGLAAFTGGASLALTQAAIGGGLIGSTLGSQADAAKSASKADKVFNEQLSRDREAQKRLTAEKNKAEALLAKEKSKVDAGIARAMRRRFKSPSGFLEASGSNIGAGVLG